MDTAVWHRFTRADPDADEQIRMCALEQAVETLDGAGNVVDVARIFEEYLRDG